MYDAMGKTLNELEGLILEDDKVMATVITDGMENSSREYSGRIIKNLVARLREKGWAMAYIGANQDSIEVARDLNIGNALNFTATPKGLMEMSKRFRKSSQKMARMAEEDIDLGRCENLFDE